MCVTLAILLNELRWVDLGIDLAWDMFLGLTLILGAIALKIHPGFGTWWAAPMMMLGISIIVLNLITFPHPANTKEVLDIGPMIGTFMTVYAARILYLGYKLK